MLKDIVVTELGTFPSLVELTDLSLDQAWMCGKYTTRVFCLGPLTVSEPLSHLVSVQPGV